MSDRPKISVKPRLIFLIISEMILRHLEINKLNTQLFLLMSSSHETLSYAHMRTQTHTHACTFTNTHTQTRTTNPVTHTGKHTRAHTDTCIKNDVFLQHMHFVQRAHVLGCSHEHTYIQAHALTLTHKHAHMRAAKTHDPYPNGQMLHL